MLWFSILIRYNKQIIIIILQKINRPVLIHRFIYYAVKAFNFSANLDLDLAALFL